MTIDEAIAKYKNKAEEHEQLAEWLEELKAYREKKCNKSVYMASKSIDKIDAVNKGYACGYNKTIDDFVKFANTMPTVEEDDGTIRPHVAGRNGCTIKGAEMSEWLTDKEKRILFAALTREKEVCIEVDKQCEPREPYEQSLQSVCESLEHKFYYDRLFKKMEKQIRAEAIDDFVNACEKQFTTIYGQRYIDTRDIKDIAELLKEQENEQRNNNG